MANCLCWEGCELPGTYSTYKCKFVPFTSLSQSSATMSLMIFMSLAFLILHIREIICDFPVTYLV